MMRKIVLTIILLVVSTLSGLSQTEASQTAREKENWAVGGIITWLSPTFDYYDKNLERYNPVVPMLWVGTSSLDNGALGDRLAQLHLRSGIFNKFDCGFTILQVSRNLYRGVVGVSAGFQVGGTEYSLESGYGAKKDGHRVEIAPSDDDHDKRPLSFTSVRIPLLVGAQTNNRLFSLQTGVGLCHTTRFGAQWMVTAGLGPVTVNYTHNLTPLFKLGDGTKAYPTSISVGFDVWYFYCRFTHPK